MVNNCYGRFKNDQHRRHTVHTSTQSTIHPYIFGCVCICDENIAKHAQTDTDTHTCSCWRDVSVMFTTPLISLLHRRRPYTLTRTSTIHMHTAHINRPVSYAVERYETNHMTSTSHRHTRSSSSSSSYTRIHVHKQKLMRLTNVRL